MYRAKDEGLHKYCFYSKEMTKQAADYIRLSSELRLAIDNNQFEIHYQPIISINDKSIVSFEALVRWQHPERGLVYPDHFIPYAEKSRLITNIDHLILEESCRQANEWLKLGYDFNCISVNVSGAGLNEGFLSALSEILDKTGLPPEKLKLEVTETFLMTRLKRPIEILKQVRKLGVGIAIDDFGVGYSSLARLKKLPVTCLKIDRSFIQDIAENNDDLAIIEAIISLSNSLKLSVIAEGVETAEQLQALNKLDADQAQGDYIFRPVPADKIDEIYGRVKTM
jgi:EAL domain-containing protein (putative c-di-GMP-specific phosphodiesterase class I)